MICKMNPEFLEMDKHESRTLKGQSCEVCKEGKMRRGGRERMSFEVIFLRKKEAKVGNYPA